MTKALIAMSGGVDSSVAALLMKRRGYDCIGCTMRLYDNEAAGIGAGNTCCSLSDVEDARSVAYRLGMPYHVFNFTEDFEEKVIRKFVRSYERGVTPNPCIDCNRYMKFEKLFERARILGCEYVVTGHYARIEHIDGEFVLKKALDESKDQSYVLYSMTQEQLKHTLFPLGEMRKTETRILAEENGLINAKKPDSQDICFVPDGDYAAAIERLGGKTPQSGDFIDTKGCTLGRHRGIIHYTVGQRRGLGLSFEQPMYVCGISAKDNTVTLGTKEELLKKTVRIRELHWISAAPPPEELRCGVKLRYHQPEQPATVKLRENGCAEIVFDQAQRAAAPGQAAVLYRGDAVLGGGVIE